MNRKKAITIHAVVEFFIMFAVIALYVSNVISVTTFVAIVASVGLISGAVMIVIFRKFPPAE